jgi:intein-encoded DNA endonuclease-like protein
LTNKDPEGPIYVARQVGLICFRQHIKIRSIMEFLHEMKDGMEKIRKGLMIEKYRVFENSHHHFTAFDEANFKIGEVNPLKIDPVVML